MTLTLSLEHQQCARLPLEPNEYEISPSAFKPGWAFHSLAAWLSVFLLAYQNNQFWQGRFRYASNYKNTQISWQPEKVRKRITSLLFLTYLVSAVKLACSTGNLWPQGCGYQPSTSQSPPLTIAAQNPLCNELGLQSTLGRTLGESYEEMSTFRCRWCCLFLCYPVCTWNLGKEQRILNSGFPWQHPNAQGSCKDCTFTREN